MCFISINGFQLERKDRSYSAGGGLLLYIANGLNYKRRVDLEGKCLDTVETIWMELRLTSKPILVCLVYRPPK